jgi:hypothetical protein
MGLAQVPGFVGSIQGQQVDHEAQRQGLPLGGAQGTSEASQGFAAGTAYVALHGAALKVGQGPQQPEQAGGVALTEGSVNCQGYAQGRAGAQGGGQLQNLVQSLHGACEGEAGMRMSWDPARLTSHPFAPAPLISAPIGCSPQLLTPPLAL